MSTSGLTASARAKHTIVRSDLSDVGSRRARALTGTFNGAPLHQSFAQSAPCEVRAAHAGDVVRIPLGGPSLACGGLSSDTDGSAGLGVVRPADGIFGAGHG